MTMRRAAGGSGSRRDDSQRHSNGHGEERRRGHDSYDDNGTYRSAGGHGVNRSKDSARHGQGDDRHGSSYVTPNRYGTYRPRGNTKSSDTYYRGAEYSTSGRPHTHVNDDYRHATASGRYGSDSVQQYSRSNYQHSNAGKQQQKRRGKHSLAIIISVIAVVAIGIGIFWYYHTMPVTLTVNGTKREVAYNTTYAGLHDLGYLVQENGDLVAVDGSVLTKGAGQQFKVYVDGNLVSNNNARVKKNVTVTEDKGDNTTEDAIVTETPVSWTWDASGSHHDGSLGITITPGTDGTAVTKTGKISGKTVTVNSATPMVQRTCRWYNVTVPSDQKVIALTFDDGPSDTYTQQILDILSENGAVGTFFELGQNVEKYPALSKAVVQQGSQVGSHSYDHPYYFTTIGKAALQEELRKAQEAIYNATGVTVTTVRAPGGEFDATTWTQTGDYMSVEVYWNVDTQDWEKPGSATIVNNAVSNAKNGRIILMHDGGGNRDQTVAALKEIVPQLKAQGYTFVTIDQLVQIQKDYLISQGVITADGNLGSKTS